MKAYSCRDAEERIHVLRMELDYELSNLYEALKGNHPHKIDQCKARREEIRKEMIMLEAL